MKSLILLIAIGLLFLAAWQNPEPKVTITPEGSVADLLEKLGESASSFRPDMEKAGVSLELGEALVLKGKISGGRSKQSKHFECIACHNVKKEDPDLRISDPEARLQYAIDNQLPFLQGTTLYGTVNRTNFYNGDYYKKYGDLVKPTRQNIREAIQLCAVECSQGRRLNAAELESVLAFLWTLDLKVKDLDLSSEEIQLIESSFDGETDREKAIDLIKSKYLSGSPASFTEPPSDRKTGYQYEGDTDKGKWLYELSCLHCHENGRYAFFKLDRSKMTFKHLQKHIPKHTRYSLYQVTRYGTSPMNGKRTYMPQYPLEKMSDKQIEDLRAYIEEKAN